MEYRDGDNYKHYGVFNDQDLDFPQGVTFVFGNVSGASPTSERNGWYFTDWRSYTNNWNPSLSPNPYIGNGASVSPPDPKLEFNLTHPPASGATGYATVAVASVQSGATITLTLNGHTGTASAPVSSSSGERSGAGGIYNSAVIPFPASDFVAGTNTLVVHSSQTPVQYDAIRLEISPADATLAPQPDLTVSTSPAGSFVQGGTAAYSVTVSNVGADASIGPVTVAVTLPWSLAALPAVLTGNGWNCESSGHVVVDGFAYECVRGDSLSAGAGFPAISVSAPVLAGAPQSVQTCAVVSGGADIDTVNNQGCDISPVALGTDALNGTIAGKSGPANARVWTIEVNNWGSAPAYGVTLASFEIVRDYGAACTPAITAPTAFPIMLGMIPAGGSARANVTIDFTGCAARTRFAAAAPIIVTGRTVTTMTRTNQFR